jgi:hypothetical protein
MADKEHLIAGLKKQRSLLGDLISQLEGKSELGEIDSGAYDHITRHVEKNLKELRKLVADEVSSIARIKD